MISGLWRGPKNKSAFWRSANPESKGTPDGTGRLYYFSQRQRTLNKIASETNCKSKLGSFERSCLKRVRRRIIQEDFLYQPWPHSMFAHTGTCASTHTHTWSYIYQSTYTTNTIKRKKVRSLSILLNSIKKNLQVNP